MLVLQRKKGEAIFIEDVEVHVLRIRGNQVSLGVKADNCLRIIRAELKEKDAEEISGEA
jgi:carbon storage regulator CsrA